MTTVDTTEDSASAHEPPQEHYAYPHPAELARQRAERTRSRAAWGALGGLGTSYRYGPEHFRALALKRWGR